MEVNAEMEQPKRPVFLQVLCILTFIATGMGLLGNLTSLLGGPQSAEKLEKGSIQLVKLSNELRDEGMNGFAAMMDQFVDLTYHINEHFYGVILISLFTTTTGLLGAIMMWKGRRLGFHAYIAYCFLYVFQIYIFVPVDVVPLMAPITNGIIALVFIFMYSRNLHWLK